MILKPALVRVLEGLNLSECYEGDVEDALLALDSHMVKDHEIEVHSGASKMALVFAKDKLVFKWATCHSGGADDEGVREALYYQKAQKLGLEMFFPKTEIFAKFGKNTVICQEMVDYSTAEVPRSKQKKYEAIGKTVRWEITEKFKQDYREGIHKGYGSCRDFNMTWLCCVISLYGKKVAKKLCDFLVDNHIDDLHGYNIGYKNDKPIILDFSGYRVPTDFIQELNSTYNLI